MDAIQKSAKIAQSDRIKKATAKNMRPTEAIEMDALQKTARISQRGRIRKEVV